MVGLRVAMRSSRDERQEPTAGGDRSSHAKGLSGPVRPGSLAIDEGPAAFETARRRGHPSAGQYRPAGMPRMTRRAIVIRVCRRTARHGRRAQPGSRLPRHAARIQFCRGQFCRGQFCEHDPPPLPRNAAGRWVGSGQPKPTLLTQRFSPRTLSLSSSVTGPDLRAGSPSPCELLPIFGRSKPFPFGRRSLDIEGRRGHRKTVPTIAT
jgi:hypothetical protein